MSLGIRPPVAGLARRPFNPHFLVVSLGNPLPEYASLHSAGHFVLNGLTKTLQQPAFSETRLGKKRCKVSQGPKYTLVQSPTLMNVSGPFVNKAWQELLRQHEPESLGLVLVHDELEKAFGDVRIQPWERSHHGHNGIRSVKDSFRRDDFPQSPVVRIAVGIGRPESRSPGDVARYVLATIPQAKQRKLEGSISFAVAEKLQELEEEWSRAF